MTETVLIGSVVALISGLLAAWIKQSINSIISALKANTDALNRLTTDYKVQDERLNTINHTLANHSMVHKALDASIDVLGSEVSIVKTKVSILEDRSGTNNRVQAA